MLCSQKGLSNRQSFAVAAAASSKHEKRTGEGGIEPSSAASELSQPLAGSSARAIWERGVGLLLDGGSRRLQRKVSIRRLQRISFRSCGQFSLPPLHSTCSSLMEAIHRLHLYALAILVIVAMVVPPTVAGELCRRSCGNIPVRYPLGIDDGCGSPYYRNMLTCADNARSASAPRLARIR